MHSPVCWFLHGSEVLGGFGVGFGGLVETWQFGETCHHLRFPDFLIARTSVNPK